MSEVQQVRGELEYVQDVEIVDDRPSWEEMISEWTEGATQALRGQLRQARAANAVTRYYGRSSVEAFAREVGVSKSTAYDYSRVWSIYGHLFEDDEYSERLESGRLGISHFIEASHAPDPIATLDEAEDEGKSSRQIKAERQAPPETPKNVEMVDVGTCPQCGAIFKTRNADIRSEVAE